MFIKKIPSIINTPYLILFNVIISAIPLYMAIKRYDNYVFGKFDLGNMNQMLYNSTRLSYMTITDYFGANVSRWSMSHVDPSLLIFIPINLFYTDANFLLFAQNICFLLSSFFIFLISKQYKISNFNSWLLSLLVYLMPISGFITVWTTFHPPAISVPIYLLIYYVLLVEKKNKNIINVKWLYFIVFLLTVIFVFGKEELGVVFAVSTLFLINSFPKHKKFFTYLGVASLAWSLICLFVIIPIYSKARVNSLQNFISQEEISGNYDDISNSNYFLYRYSELGDTYKEIFLSIVLNPENFISIIISPTNLQTLNKILFPNLYSVLLVNPYLFISFWPETFIQLLSADPEVFSITNHRLLPVLPFLFISNILLYLFVKKRLKVISEFLLPIMVLLNIYLSISYRSPLIFGLYDKSKQLLGFSYTVAHASRSKTEFNNNISLECPNFLLGEIDKNHKVSVPQPFGAKTSNREFNALFPTGLNTADVVISDIYDRKIADFLDVDTLLNRKLVTKYINKNNLQLEFVCDRFFFFKRVPTATSIGEIFWVNFTPETSTLNLYPNYKILDDSYFVSSNIKKTGNVVNFSYSYLLGEEDGRGEMFIYTIIENEYSRWQFVNPPSYYITSIDNIPINSLVTESFTLKIPQFVKSGLYRVYFGIGDRVRNEENIYIGELQL